MASALQRLRHDHRRDTTVIGVSSAPPAVGGAALLTGETDGFATDFTYAMDAQRVASKTASITTSVGLDSFYSQSGTSPKQVFDISGNLVWSPHNMYIQSATPATRTVTTVVGQNYTVTVTGSGSLTGSSGAAGVATQASPLTYVASGTSSIFTLAGSLTQVQMNRGAAATAYLATTAAARIGLAVDYHPSTHAALGLLGEPAATNLLLNNGTLSTQSVTVTAVAHTLSFLGTGTVTLSGTSTAGPLVGTGASDRVFLTFTPTAGSLTLTVSGTVSNAQLETGSVPSSIIPTFAATATRASDNHVFLLSLIPTLGAEYSLYVQFSIPATSSSRYPFVLTNAAATEWAGIRESALGAALLVNTAGGSQVATTTLATITVNVPAKVAARIKLNDFAAAANGGTVVTDTAGLMPTVTHGNFGGTPSVNPVLAIFRIQQISVATSRGWSNARIGDQIHMIDFMFRSATRKDFEAMARTAAFIDDENNPLAGIDIDPTIGTPEYETGIPIIDVPSPDGETPATLKSGWHCNVRVSGERELQETEGLPQIDEEGNLLPAAERTHFGIAFSDSGTVVADGTTEGIQYANVALVDETTIASPQRVWQ